MRVKETCMVQNDEIHNVQQTYLSHPSRTIYVITQSIQDDLKTRLSRSETTGTYVISKTERFSTTSVSNYQPNRCPAEYIYLFLSSRLQQQLIRPSIYFPHLTIQRTESPQSCSKRNPPNHVKHSNERLKSRMGP